MNQLLFMIHNSLELYENLCQPVCRECGIAQTALDILMFLANNPEYYTARDICRVRGIKANLVSFHVEKLVQEGYLERESITGDRRQVRLQLTGKSQRVIEQGRSVQQRYREILVSNIAPYDFETFQRCMDTIRQNIERAKKISAKAKSTEKEDKKKVEGQFDMYNYKLAEIAHELDKVNLNELTPIDALNTLVKIKEKMK